MTPTRTWRTVRRLAATNDVVLVSTIRALRGPLTTPTVLDHVDALSLNMLRRARGPERVHRRVFAALESRRLARLERRAADWVAGQIATSAEDAAALAPMPPPQVIPVTWDGGEAPVFAPEIRPIDVVLSGNMRYPPNEDAARWLVDEILPSVRAARPGIRALIVGRDAGRLGLRDVEVRADVAEMQPHLRSAKLAVVPLRIGTGAPYKLLEAAAAGCAIVATPWAAARFDVPCRVAVDTDGFVGELLALLGDDVARARLTEQAHAALGSHSTAAAAALLESLLRHASKQ